MTKFLRRYLTGTAASLMLVAAASTEGAGALAAPGVRPAFGQAFAGRLYGAAATSAGNVWAVGLNGCCGLIIHFNGSTWTQDPVSPTGFFDGVAAVSAKDAWAVGGTSWFGTDPMIYHWNGTVWTKVTVPAPSAGGFLTSVTAPSAANAWAVGATGGGPGDGNGPGEDALIYHWNGHRWTRVPAPAPGPASQLQGVSAISASDAWAVGWTGYNASNGTIRTFIVHWDGRTWTRVPSPSGKPGVRADLEGVVALSADDAWAAGSQHEDRNRLVFVLHWNGRTWRKVHSPTPGMGGNLLGIGASSPDNVWAVGQGSVNGGCSDGCQPTIVHWNGSRWNVVTDPAGLRGGLNILFTVAATSARNAWAVGTSAYGTTLEAHWNGRAWS